MFLVTARVGGRQAPTLRNNLGRARGEYLARTVECIACHTATGGKPFEPDWPKRLTVFTGRGPVSDDVFRFVLPTITGNLFGGVALAALLNHAAVAHDIAAKFADPNEGLETKPSRRSQADTIRLC
jgi:hypothetical protein